MKLLPLAIALFGDTARSRLTGLTTTAKFLAVFGSLAAVSAAFFLIAITILLSQQIGAVYACLVMSAIFAVLALLVLMLHVRERRRREAIKAQTLALASSARTTTGAGAMMLAQAFIRGFFGGKR